MTPLQRAEKLVRDKLQIPPEKEVQGFDYLMALEEPVDEVYISGTGLLVYAPYGGEEGTLCNFNLTKGRPATEKDAEEFIRLIENV